MLASVFFSLQILRAFLVGSPDSSIASFQTLKSSGHSPYPEPVALKWEGRGLLTRAVQEVPWCSEHGPSEEAAFPQGNAPREQNTTLSPPSMAPRAEQEDLTEKLFW